MAIRIWRPMCLNGCVRLVEEPQFQSGRGSVVWILGGSGSWIFASGAVEFWGLSVEVWGFLL